METYKEMQGFVVGKGRLDVYIPPTEESTRWKHWRTIWDLRTCELCKTMHGKILGNTDAPGRVWYEADINYYSGKRNGHRVLWSNDGMLFVTYDHYRTFIEVA